MGIEYSLSCPQGGDGTEGDIVSQNAELTAKIIDWVLQVGDPEVPKLFKLTARGHLDRGRSSTAIREVLRPPPGQEGRRHPRQHLPDPRASARARSRAGTRASSSA